MRIHAICIDHVGLYYMENITMVKYPSSIPNWGLIGAHLGPTGAQLGPIWNAAWVPQDHWCDMVVSWRSWDVFSHYYRINVSLLRICTLFHILRVVVLLSLSLTQM